MATGNGDRTVRGSQKLLEKLARNGETPSPEDIIRTFDFPASVKIPNWLIRGIPPIYLELEGTIEVPMTDVPVVIDRLVALNDCARTFRIFPRGIPFVSVAQITLSNTAGD